jgi:hypothetical protein
MIYYRFNENLIIEKVNPHSINSSIEMIGPFFFDLQFRTPLNGEEIAQWEVNFWNDIKGQKVNLKNRVFTVPLPDEGQAMTTEELRLQFFQVCPELEGAEKIVEE